MIDFSVVCRDFVNAGDLSLSTPVVLFVDRFRSARNLFSTRGTLAQNAIPAAARVLRAWLHPPSAAGTVQPGVRRQIDGDGRTWNAKRLAFAPHVRSAFRDPQVRGSLLHGSFPSLGR
jgi:hypothetical protein